MADRRLGLHRQQSTRKCAIHARCERDTNVLHRGLVCTSCLLLACCSPTCSQGRQFGCEVGAATICCQNVSAIRDEVWWLLRGVCILALNTSCAFIKAVAMSCWLAMSLREVTCAEFNISCMHRRSRKAHNIRLCRAKMRTPLHGHAESFGILI